MTSNTNGNPTGPQPVVTARDPHQPPPRGRHRLTAHTPPQHRASQLIVRRDGWLSHERARVANTAVTA